ncbi:hypothetical protein GV829_04090 [Sphingomonas lacunae]|uniref:Uncharacterized protein n=1 Tax=Sphingomonas lacunae TaxID=2698828 RepID=A0A6M4ATR4_9SPHN|nr:hypothetical protein [Sphingomonas lacunae]QJQ31722.1 hypothetical protein GV829_04090 [Sphingomonas lacunae]
MTPLPPSRYRIEERGRRLIVIDQWAGNVELTGTMPARADVVRPGKAASVAPGALSAKAASHQAAARASARPTAASASSSPRMAGAAGSGEGANALTKAFFRLQPDGRGGASLTTHRLYDPRGPRLIVLTAPHLARLNGLAIVLAFSLVMALGVGLIIGWPVLLVLGFILFRLNNSIRDRIGQWLDKLE